MNLDLPSLGLRAAKKERTRQALGEAAVAIVATEGIDALTAERIAAEAGVSRRTLFNYFARVEDVLTASIEQVTEDTVAAFVARPPSEPLRDSIVAVLGGLLDDPVFAQAFVLERAAEASPATRRFLREFSDSQIDAFEAGLRDRLGPDADPVYVASLAASAGAILTRMTRLVVAETPDADPSDASVTRRHHDATRRAFDLLFAGFDEAGALTDKDN
ncbi:TetR/AcrR family transcriptional regulator [Nocardioides sp.]|uniref:TetR/AcrR family transcriptional regulator n=1 Tax=Nocardioides sp. TaxID=35761 RepID=UPI00286E1A0C|nr:TetR/AcrR family transcriptional regulator [Nocardioides sp.]